MAGVLVGPSKMLPLYGNFIQCKALGFDIQIWDAETGERIDDTGKPGELIVAKPFPTQPVSTSASQTELHMARCGKLTSDFLDGYLLL